MDKLKEKYNYCMMMKREYGCPLAEALEMWRWTELAFEWTKDD